jgi:hypothetical protein
MEKLFSLQHPGTCGELIDPARKRNIVRMTPVKCFNGGDFTRKVSTGMTIDVKI